MWQLTPQGADDDLFHPHMPYTADTFPRYPGSKQFDLHVGEGKYPSFVLTMCTDDPREKVEAYYKDLLSKAGWQYLDALDTTDGLKPHYFYEAPAASGHRAIFSYNLLVTAYSECSWLHMRTAITAGFSFDLPLYPNSDDVQRRVTFGADTITYRLNFETADSKNAVLDYYRDLLGEGWHLETPTVINPDAPTLGALWHRSPLEPEYQIGNPCADLYVYVTQAAGNTRVEIQGITP